MGFFDKIKEFADTSIKKYKLSQKEKEIKKALLMRFAMWQLQNICRGKKISTKVEGKRGKREARSKAELIPNMLKKLNIEEIVKYAKKHGIQYRDLLNELEEYRIELFASDEIEDIEETITSEFDEILGEIKMGFRPEKTRDEEELEKQLVMFLKMKLGEDRVDRQYHKDGKRVDIVIDGKYGIELKIAESYGSIASLPTQLRLYRKRFKDVAAVLVKPEDKDVEIDEILELLDEDGFKYVIIEAPIKRRRWRF